MRRNEVAKLAQERKLVAGWLVSGLFFYALPCGKVQNPQDHSIQQAFEPQTKIFLEQRVISVRAGFLRFLPNDKLSATRRFFRARLVRPARPGDLETGEKPPRTRR